MSSKRYTEEFKLEAVQQVTERGFGGPALIEVRIDTEALTPDPTSLTPVAAQGGDSRHECRTQNDSLP